jgi:hypothetical protein
MEQLGDFILHAFQFVEPQSWVGDDENIAGPAVFVNQNTPVRSFLGLYLFQYPLALKHGSQDVARIRRRIFRCNQTAEELLGIFFWKRFSRRRRQRLIARSPKGKRLNILVSIAPRLFAQIFASITIGVVKKQGVEIFPGCKWPMGHGAGIRPMLDRPFVWQRIHCATIRRAVKR